MTEHIRASKERNKNYFRSLISTRASIGMLGVGGLVGIGFGMVTIFPYWGTVVDLGFNPLYDPISMLLLLSLIFSLISIFAVTIEPIRLFLFQHQRFSSIWQFLIVFMMLFLFVIGFMMIGLAKPDGRVDLYHSPYTFPLSLGVILFYVSCIGYNIFWLCKQLHSGMSEERTAKNYEAKTSVFSSKSLLIIFGFTFLTPLVLTRSFENAFGIGSLVFLIGAFSRLHVEYAYAAILKWRDKEYWEEYRREDGIIIPKKKWLFMIRLMVEMGLFWSLAILFMDVLPESSLLSSIVALVILIILIYWFIRIILWRIRKNKEKQKR